MKTAKTAKKLLLQRETVRVLTSRDLSRIGGGHETKGCAPTASNPMLGGANHNETLLRARKCSR